MRRRSETDEGLTSEDTAEIIRKRYRYQQLILSGELVLPHPKAAQLLGPDCLYRLYSLQKPENRSVRAAGSGPGKRKSRTKPGAKCTNS